MRSKRFIGVSSVPVRLIALALLTQDVDAAELRDGRVDGRVHARLVADVADDRQRMTAGRLDFRRGGVDRSGKLRMRLGRLGRDDDIGAVARRAHGDGEPDAARAAADEQRLAA